ncbi:MAG: hypothetical protein BM556_09335 [Bacteriovorax sp. MedPE-SWde]|nr:MAG: hypothetical protein BM556_09335 [Bacteriovorax sp. MedPE-SWde]
MNKIFSKFGIDVPLDNFDNLVEVTTNLQDGTLKHIVFYRLNNTDISQNLFRSRIENKEIGLLILNCEPSSKINIPYVVINYDDFFNLQKEICNQLYPKSFDVKLIGITGTNGKSTVVHLCHEILNKSGHKAFTVGTIGICEGEKEILPAPGATTPSYVDLRRILHKLSSYEYACIEVSSHALDQARLNGFELEVSGFTNLSQDHLDYHGTMDKYLKAKLLIGDLSKKPLIVPHDEDDLVSMLTENNVDFEIAKKASVKSVNDSFSLSYNEKNLSLASLLANRATNSVLEIPKDISLPKGRYNSFRYNKSLYVVDYAHTPDALSNVVSETRRAFPKSHIITIFGCGGDRDRLKRPRMLEAILEISDEIVVTTDNPRTEDPQSIIDDAVKGNIENPKVETILDRKSAIKKYVRDYSDETIVIVAGKGHEEYQDVNGVKHYFSDIEEIKTVISEMKSEG